MRPRTSTTLAASIALVSSTSAALSIPSASAIPFANLHTRATGPGTGIPDATVYTNLWINKGLTLPENYELATALIALQAGLDTIEATNPDKRCIQRKVPGIDRADGEPVWCQDGISVRYAWFDPFGAESTVGQGFKDDTCLGIIQRAYDFVRYIIQPDRESGEVENRRKLTMNPRTHCYQPGVFQPLGLVQVTNDDTWGVSIAKEKCGGYGPVQGCKYAG
ncbi:hypothetical protein Dda_8382 [Drechslerella dactyloides]|uniref:Uncharacterized protein n=1 Tax=Drechslerella dactyloides TaxID=74499 RepID=A0AAD6IQA8_DREDA|nr:hypothetical protein Dda_8382 [Drechslerella dactyloides]